MAETKDTIEDILQTASDLRWKVGDGFHDKLTEGIYTDASSITERAVIHDDDNINHHIDRKLDQILTSRKFGFPIMVMILSIVLWVTIQGANYPEKAQPALLKDN